MSLSRDDLALIKSAGYNEVARVFEYERKGIPQYFYVIEVDKEGSYWDEGKEDFVQLPERLTGLFISEYTGNIDTAFDTELLNNYSFCRAIKEDVIITKYVPSGEQE